MPYSNNKILKLPNPAGMPWEHIGHLCYWRLKMNTDIQFNFSSLRVKPSFIYRSVVGFMPWGRSIWPWLQPSPVDLRSSQSHLSSHSLICSCPPIGQEFPVKPYTAHASEGGWMNTDIQLYPWARRASHRVCKFYSHMCSRTCDSVSPHPYPNSRKPTQNLLIYPSPESKKCHSNNRPLIAVIQIRWLWNLSNNSDLHDLVPKVHPLICRRVSTANSLYQAHHSLFSSRCHRFASATSQH